MPNRFFSKESTFLCRVSLRCFHVDEVDEFRTLKTCNLCMGELKRYRKRLGGLSYSRLYCESCGGEEQKPSKRCVDRDVNAALNVLLVGISPTRPEALSRKKEIHTGSVHSFSPTRGQKGTKRPVAAGRKSSDPVSVPVPMLNA